MYSVMFVVIQKSDDVEQCIGIIQQEDEFLNYIKNYTSKYGPKYIENIEVIELKKDQYEDLHYLVSLASNDNELVLVNKYRTVSRGYFYNSMILHMDIIASYRYIVYTSELDEYLNNMDALTFLEYDSVLPNDFKNSLISIIGNIDKQYDTIKSIVYYESKEYIDNSLIITKNIEYYAESYPSAKIISRYDAKIMKEYLNKDTGCIIIDNIIIPKRTNGYIWDIFFFKSNKLRIISANDAIMFTPRIKRRIDYHLFLRTVDKKKIEKLWNVIGNNVFDNKGSFITIFDQMTHNYGIMVLKKEDESYKIFRYNSIQSIPIHSVDE